jgi:hypothetical protein
MRGTVFSSLFLVAGSFARDFYVVNEGLNDSTWSQEDWTLSTNMFVPAQYQTRMSLANGYVLSIARLSSANFADTWAHLLLQQGHSLNTI